MGYTRVLTAIEAFLDEVPELRDHWATHLEDYEEPLPHVFFGSDVCRFAVSLAESDHDEALARFSAAIERLSESNDPDIQNIIHVSFAENFVWGDEREQRALARLRPGFGPETEIRFREFEAWAAEAAHFDPERDVPQP
jgi:hypothetical protein